MFDRIRFLFQLTHSHRIARRYFVTNGFDGVLAMLGLLMGFYVSGEAPLTVMLSACFGTAIALFMSGLTSAYISESAEKIHELRELEKSMLTQLDESAHAEAARLMPFVIALVNGLSPLLFSLLIISPLILAHQGVWFNFSSLLSAIFIALGLSFFLGVFVGQFSRSSWLWAGMRALLIALLTSMIILSLT